MHQTRTVGACDKPRTGLHVALHLVQSHLCTHGRLLDGEHAAKATTLVGTLRLKYLNTLHQVQQVFDLVGRRSKAFRVNHNILCYGYSIELDRKGRFNAEAAKELEIPIKLWKVLQSGNDVTVDGKVFTSDMVMGEDRKGLKVTYCTDTRPTDVIAEAAGGSDLFICEGMYGENDAETMDKAKAKKHMTMTEAALLAEQAGVAEMWLTHYSPSITKPKMYLDDIKKIFPNTVMGKDRLTKELKFED